MDSHGLEAQIKRIFKINTIERRVYYDCIPCAPGSASCLANTSISVADGKKNEYILRAKKNYLKALYIQRLCLPYVKSNRMVEMS